MEINKLTDIAIKARKVFEEHHMEISGVLFNMFPRASCGPSADLIAQYLKDNGVKNVVYVYGERGSGSHGWLEIDDVIVDITSDQFKDGVGAVYVSVDRTFHNNFLPHNKNTNPQLNGMTADPYRKFKIFMGQHA
jgi:hypothetical protein